MRNRIILSSIFLLALGQYLTAPMWYHGHFGGDFWIYYYGGEGWLYADFTRIYWAPFRLMPYELAWGIWYALNVTATLVLAHLTNKIHYAITLAFIPIFWYNWGTGNVLPQLALFCLTPLGCIVSGTVKPYLWAILLLHSLGSCPYPRVQAYLSQVRSALRLDSLTHTQEEA